MVKPVSITPDTRKNIHIFIISIFPFNSKDLQWVDAALTVVKDILVKVQDLHVNATMVSSHDPYRGKITLTI